VAFTVEVLQDTVFCKVVSLLVCNAIDISVLTCEMDCTVEYGFWGFAAGGFRRRACGAFCGHVHFMVLPSVKVQAYLLCLCHV
jgi:hypothetical protein